MHFKLPELPFEASAVAGWLSQETLDIHHGIHHRNFVENLNLLLPGSGLEGASIQEVIRHASGPLLNNAAEAWNHSFYWLSIAPNPRRDPLKDLGDLKARLTEGFGSLDSFLQGFSELANAQFGSGWIWLAEEEKSGKLQTLLTRNADTPARHGLKPLLACDLWEHAYYIDYRNSRSRYTEGFLRSIHWKFVDANLRLPSGALAAGQAFPPRGKEHLENEKTKKEKKWKK